MGRILVVDNHEVVRGALAHGLKDAGHQVEEAGSADHASVWLHNGYFDVVVTDLQMIGSDGMDVLRTTRALHPSTAVIMMTAVGIMNPALDALKNGAFDCIRKPFEIDELKIRIDNALEMRRLTNELQSMRGAVVRIPPKGMPLEDIERAAVVEALKMANWVQKDAATLLSISPRVMSYKIKTLGIRSSRNRGPVAVAPIQVAKAS
jgi:DNA-binding NtrC family response regulator